MRRYRNSAGSPIRTDYGIGLQAGLRAFPETSALADPLEVLNDELEVAYLARQALRKPMVHARMGVRFGNYHVDQAIRMTHSAAHIADGGRRGPVTIALFPDGLTPVVVRRGSAQIKPCEELLGRFSKSKLPGVVQLAATWMPRIQTALTSLKASSTSYEGARKAYVDAYAEEFAQRAEHARQVDRLMGLVRAEFPRDKAKQDVIFPDPTRDKSVPAEEDEDEEDEAAAAALAEAMSSGEEGGRSDAEAVTPTASEGPLVKTALATSGAPAPDAREVDAA
ncbi:hypothetical protein [Chondromyces crocatus]|uniref:Uncharacterized protein n=1 Tax=Chondromyces crocatus TaxID=52 RepID=A0A0K1EJK6_CHOCO|nr:hypothetical protein [Chondromyces crocatus]AKT40857.1 uncharacterized protein CMC5_050120 [Chondromyces crocatus]